MAGLSFLSEIGKQGMLLNQFKIQVTGKNVANVNTAGYSRQRVDVNPILPELLASFSLGSAIKGDTLRRIRENFVDRQFWSQNSLLAQYNTEESLLSQIEGVLPASNETGLGVMLDEFWGSWNDLANDPESSVTRTLVRDRAQTLALSFNRAFDEIVSFQNTVAAEVKDRVAVVNDLASQIAELNKLNPGGNPDLDDQRDRLIGRMAEIANIAVEFTETGVSVFVSGLQLVSGRTAFEIAVQETTGENGIGQIRTTIGGTDREIKIQSGELSGLIAVHNNDIPDLLDRLDTLAVSVAEEVNAIHLTGFNLTDVTGLNFFADTVEGAASLAVDSAILADVDLIATSDAAGEPGNGNIAKAMADLADKEVIGNQTIGQFYRSMVGTLGNRIQESAFLAANQQRIVEHLEGQRQSVAGVSMEEEMTRLMQLEQAFTAASRLVTMADELTRTVLNMV
ncbi:MAG: flagellar hook-associated protein FlgK [Candidatus Neomarinimicrobiota bacterium]